MAMRASTCNFATAGSLLVQVVNPVCAEDVLTDRWPGSLAEQAAFIAYLDDLVVKGSEGPNLGCTNRADG